MIPAKSHLPFIDSIGGDPFPPPYRFEGVLRYDFPVAASRTKIQDMCDRYLNIHMKNNERWTPISPTVKIQVLSYKKMISEPFENFGYDTQNEFAVQIPLILRQDGIATTTFGLFAPFLVVDSPISMVTGREVMGYPKSLGTISMSDSSCRVKTWVRERFGPDETAKEDVILDVEIERDADDDAARLGLEAVGMDALQLWPFGPLRQLYITEDGGEAALENTGSPFAADEDVQVQLLRRENSLNQQIAAEQFKEFRAPDAVAHADFQSRVSAVYDVAKVHGGGLLSVKHLKLHSYASLNLIDLFGLQHHGGVLTPRASTWLDFDFRMHSARSLFRDA